MDKFIIYPGEVRGGGNITSDILARDIWKNGCDIDDDTALIDGVSRPIYTLFGSSDSFTVSEIMALLSGNLIKNLRYADGSILYDNVAVSSITSMTDLNGIIYNLSYSNGEISFETWQSTNTNLHMNDIYILESAVQTLSYTDYEIDYTNVGEINV